MVPKQSFMDNTSWQWLILGQPKLRSGSKLAVYGWCVNMLLPVRIRLILMQPAIFQVSLNRGIPSVGSRNFIETAVFAHTFWKTSKCSNSSRSLVAAWAIPIYYFQATAFRVHCPKWRTPKSSAEHRRCEELACSPIHIFFSLVLPQTIIWVSWNVPSSNWYQNQAGCQVQTAPPYGHK